MKPWAGHQLDQPNYAAMVGRASLGGRSANLIMLQWWAGHPSEEGVLAFGLEDGTVGVYNVSKMKHVLGSTSHTRGVSSVCWRRARATTGALLLLLLLLLLQAQYYWCYYYLVLLQVHALLLVLL